MRQQIITHVASTTRSHAVDNSPPLLTALGPRDLFVVRSRMEFLEGTGASAAPMIPRLLAFARQQAGLGPYLQTPGDGRVAPVVPAPALLSALLAAYVLRDGAFHAVEALVRSPARRPLGRIPTRCACFGLCSRNITEVKYLDVLPVNR